MKPEIADAYHTCWHHNHLIDFGHGNQYYRDRNFDLSDYRDWLDNYLWNRFLGRDKFGHFIWNYFSLLSRDNNYSRQNLLDPDNLDHLGSNNIPNNLVTDPEFDDGLQPWQAIPYPDQDLSLTFSSYKTEKAALLHFSSKSGSPFTNYLYHHIDKSLLKAGSYVLEGFVKVHSPGDEGEGCTRVVAACLVGPIGETEAILNVGVLPAIAAESRWANISTISDVTEDKLEEIGDFGVAIGFECFNTDAYLDSVSFKAAEIEME
ncbi:hypothetical protein CEP54_009209 [Fusarium duplospermum]|uniref:Uncharacterized protein n=1 Tax=Fusarium duplospermum TaxID=1325734 RepID=A0A428PS14_9HYPO|nr:hypothetical protein CEP54_009209 [Fusarium duplospermum]